MRTFLIAGLCCTALAGCSMVQDAKAADAAIGIFHQELNSGQLDRIYAEADPQLRAATPHDELVTFLAAVERKLGPFRSGQAQGFRDNLLTSGHFVNVTYAATYVRGAASESFVYRVEGSRLALAGYNITSRALIVN